MKSPGPPLRFLIVVVTVWIGGRTAMLAWPSDTPGRRPVAPAPPDPRRAFSPPAPARRDPAATTFATGLPALLPAEAGASAGVRTPLVPAARSASSERSEARRERFAALAADPPRPAKGIAVAPAPAPATQPVTAAASAPQFPAEPTLGPRVVQVAASSVERRWSGAVFLFGRSGGGAVPLAGGGQLGASQAGARIAYRIDRAGHVAAAARVYAPIDSLDASEAAAGLDFHPLPGAPLRLSVERRVALGGQGRDAWSAYAAGGFFRGLGRSIELDGYAQAGVVGVHARDLFADGALRAARRFDLGGGRAVLAGAGAWAAAQPGVERVDVGPRVALRLPAGAAAISIAGEWRARVAGSARPPSGPALTIAADF